jgi:hypothetical protein
MNFPPSTRTGAFTLINLISISNAFKQAIFVIKSKTILPAGEIALVKMVETTPYTDYSSETIAPGCLESKQHDWQDHLSLQGPEKVRPGRHGRGFPSPG